MKEISEAQSLGHLLKNEINICIINFSLKVNFKESDSQFIGLMNEIRGGIILHFKT